MDLTPTDVVACALATHLPEALTRAVFEWGKTAGEWDAERHDDGHLVPPVEEMAVHARIVIDTTFHHLARETRDALHDVYMHGFRDGRVDDKGRLIVKD